MVAVLIAGQAAEFAREKVQNDRAASAGVSIQRRMAADVSLAVQQPSQTTPTSGSANFAAMMQHAHEQLDAAHAASSCQPHSPYPEESGTPGAAQAQMRASVDFQKRLSPSLPSAPSRTNSAVDREPQPSYLTFVSSSTLHRALAPSAYTDDATKRSINSVASL